MAAAVREATDDYRAEMDTLADFLNMSCEVGDDYEVTGDDIYGRYRLWCELTQGDRPMNRRYFDQQIRERGYAKAIEGARLRWRGLRIRSS
jgi:putative DNA primase/helicase